MMTYSENSRRAGFTAVELLIVVTVIAVMAALALPQFVSSKKQANEAAAISALRAISSANGVYRSRFGTYATINELSGSSIIDVTLDAPRHGYVFTDVGAADTALWAVQATPEDPGRSGDRSFYIDESGVIRFASSGTADASSSALR